MWVEVKRVKFPLKAALMQLVDQEDLDTEDNKVKYCMPDLTCRMAQLGLGKGMPNHLARAGCPARLQHNLLLPAGAAVDFYQQEHDLLRRWEDSDRVIFAPSSQTLL
ncbi:hypothetical protein SRHO_G00282720 [Serrasalmus rhombeus]